MVVLQILFIVNIVLKYEHHVNFKDTRMVWFGLTDCYSLMKHKTCERLSKITSTHK